MTEKSHKCPMCNGRGQIEPANGERLKRFKKKSEIAHKLKNEGYSFREIMALMGFKSTSAVAYYLNDENVK